MLEHLGKGKSELSLLLTSDAGITRYNERFFGRYGPTNVISFSAADAFSVGPDVLGDIAVNIDAAQRQAKIRGVSLSDEIVILAVHGLVHLLGYTHDPREGANGSDEAAMEEEEKRLLSLIGIDID